MSRISLSCLPLPRASPNASWARLSDRLCWTVSQLLMIVSAKSRPQSFTSSDSSWASASSHSPPTSTHTASSSSSGCLAMLDGETWDARVSTERQVPSGQCLCCFLASYLYIQPRPPHLHTHPNICCGGTSDLLYLFQLRRGDHGLHTPTFPVSRTK
uniref:Uncharacterized protein n=1 Tax=Myotis myotis TaxID=51298 RepID=A0A7J7R9H1_MYOMY|nr:hypothetical protein mMyoMyo1_010857 [Myotis myotis]